MNKTTYIRRKQPHFQHIGGAFSITVMAHDAIPKITLAALQEKRKIALTEVSTGLPKEEVLLQKAEIHSDFEHQMESLLHAQRNQGNLFKKTAVAEIVMDQVKKYDDDVYSLEALCVMSNHVHMLLDFSVQVPQDWDDLNEIPSYKNVSDAMKLIKGGISYKVNKVLGRTGSIWSHGYYDRFIRSVKHYEQAFFYIINNPMKAGLVEKWEDYPYTFVKTRDDMLM